MEKKVHHYNFEGLEFDIPLKWFDLQERYIEDYSVFMDEPQKYTPLGHPVIFTYADPCEEFADKITDCVDCPNFKKAEVGEGIDLSNKITLMGAPLFGQTEGEANYEAEYGTNLHSIEVYDVQTDEKIQLFAVGQTVSKQFDPSGEDSILLEIPYKGYVTPKPEDITVSGPAGTVTLIADDGNGGGNFLVQDRGNGEKYIYVSVTDKAKLQNGTWTVTVNNERIDVTTFAVIGADAIPELTETSFTKDNFKLDVSWKTDKTKSEEADINVYLTEDANVLENIKNVSVKNEQSLGTLIGTAKLSEIKSGNAEFNIPDSFANGTYYVVTTMSSRGIRMRQIIRNNCLLKQSIKVSLYTTTIQPPTRKLQRQPQI